MPQHITVKSILNKTKKRDSWFLDDYTINPYSGCSFNCLYCYIRGSKYGEHMEEKLSIKSNALEVLEKQLALRSRKQQYGFVVLSSATDPYLQFEKEEKLTRQILQLLLKYKFPVHIITKSDLVERDFDLLHQIEEEAILPLDLQGKLCHKVFVTFSFSTTDDDIAKIFEPGATAPSLRLQALIKAANENFLTGVSMMPLLPYITDIGSHMEEMFASFKNAGARYVMPASLTLFGKGVADSKTLILKAVQKHYPHLADKYNHFFAKADYMPAYYHEALRKKTMELGKRYGLPERIITA
jgi:DNA repair photolyase